MKAKKLIHFSTLTLIIFFFSLTIFAQAPEKVSYQSVIRDASGDLVVSKTVSLRISILQGSTSGTAVYIETHSVETSVSGVASVQVGTGTVESGTFSGIDWSNSPYFLKVETDPDGGTNYSITGTSEIISTPYSLYSKKAETAENVENETQGLGDVIAIDNEAYGQIKSLNNPTDGQDAATKAYVDSLLELIEYMRILTGADYVYDADGYNYRTVRIGTQLWMAENLQTTKYSNGDDIGTTSPANLDITGERDPKYQWSYDGDDNYVEVYGRLYTWYTITDSRGVCPDGWRIPTDDDWTTLQNYLIANGYNYDGTTSGNKIAQSMASQSLWNVSGTSGAPGNDLPANNTSGLNAPPGGYRIGSGTFYSERAVGDFWSASEYDTDNANFKYLNYNRTDLISTNYSKKYGLSVRCMRD